MKLQAWVFPLIVIMYLPAVAYADAPDVKFGIRATTGTSGSSVAADSSMSYLRNTRATSFQLAGHLGLATNADAQTSVQWGADNTYAWQSAARIVNQRFNFSHSEKEAIYSDKLESIDTASSLTSFQLSRNPLLSHLAGLNLSYGHAYQTLGDGTKPSSEVKSWTVFDNIQWAATNQSKLSTNLSYKEIDASVSNSTIGLGWTFLKSRQVYDSAINYTFIDAKGYDSEQLGYSLKMSHFARTMNFAAEVKKQVVDSLQLFQIAGIEEPIRENVLSSVTSVSVAAGDINALDLAKVSVFITGGVSTQLVTYKQLDFELDSDNNFASTGIKLDAPIFWGIDMALGANRGYQAEKWSSIYTIDVNKTLDDNFKLSANSKLQDDTPSWSVSLSYQH